VQVALASVTYGPANRIVGPVASATGPRGPRVKEELARLPTRASLLCASRKSSPKILALRKGTLAQIPRTLSVVFLAGPQCFDSTDIHLQSAPTSTEASQSRILGRYRREKKSESALRGGE